MLVVASSGCPPQPRPEDTDAGTTVYAIGASRARCPALGGTFSTVGPTLYPRGAHVAAVVLPSGLVLVIGDHQPAELFDPLALGGAGAFLSTGPMVAVRKAPAATLLRSGKVLIVGGAGHAAELFDPVSGTFAPTADLLIPREEPSATLLDDGRVLVAGGRNETGVLSEAELFDPEGNGGSGTFVQTGSLNEAQATPSAVKLPDGRVLVAEYRAELFDPASETFSPTNVKGSHLKVSLLSSGAALVVGANLASLYRPGVWTLLTPPNANGPGTNVSTGALVFGFGGIRLVSRGFPVNEAIYFDPSGNGGNGCFGSAGTMNEYRTKPAVALLQDGRFLIIEVTAQVYAP